MAGRLGPVGFVYLAADGEVTRGASSVQAPPLGRSVPKPWIRVSACQDRPRADHHPAPRPPPDRGHALGRVGHPARAVLRPGVRARPDPVHRADGRRPHLGRTGARTADPRGAVVVVGGLCLADQRGRSRGGDRAGDDLRGDGGLPCRGAVRAPGLRRPGAAVRGRLRRGAGRTGIVLFVVASRDDPELRKSVWGLATSTAIGVGLLVLASTADGALQGGYGPWRCS